MNKLDLSRLKKDCKKDSIDYIKIKSRYKYISKKDKYNNLNYDEKYIICKERYLNKLKYDILRINFNYLNNATKTSEYKNICKGLNIDYNRARKISYRTKNMKQAILYIWFFGDINTNSGKNITRKRLYQVNSKKLLKDSDNLYNIIAYYLCGHNEYLNNIINFENKYLKAISKKALNNLNIKKTADKINDLISEAILILIKTLKKIVINDIRYIIKYLNITLYYRIYDYAKKTYQNNLTLNENISKGKIYEEVFNSLWL